MSVSEHQKWVKQNPIDENNDDPISMQSFAEKFKLYNRETADIEYQKLITSTEITKKRRISLQERYKTFNENTANIFWTKRSTSATSQIVITQSVAHVVSAAGKRVPDELESSLDNLSRSNSEERDSTLQANNPAFNALYKFGM
jgi:hypothetical protein